ncbi:MAG: hypothetical protein Q9227_000196 [Pyrenula ochraceoflavens]
MATLLSRWRPKYKSGSGQSELIPLTENEGKQRRGCISDEEELMKTGPKTNDNDRFGTKFSHLKFNLNSGQGWHFGVHLAISGAAFALVTNVIITIAIAGRTSFHGGVATVFKGDCGRNESVNTWIHLLINAISTLLLSGSNYTMQILSAPTRVDIDRAHSSRKWLDIGVQSVRNLTHISRQRKLLWWLLAFSSIPLHLMYNSAFFATISSNEYGVFYANEDYLHGAPYNLSKEYTFNVTEIQYRVKKFERLENADCINAYAQDFLTSRRDVVLVTESKPLDNGSLQDAFPSLFSRYNYGLYSWICDNSSFQFGGAEAMDTPAEISDYSACFLHVNQILSKASDWHSHGVKIDYCMSEKVKGSCETRASLIILILVILANLAKLCAMSYTAFGLKFEPLATIGDGISSFLDQRDPTTESMCLASSAQIKAAWASHTPRSVLPQPFKPRGVRKFKSASTTTWMVTLILMALAVTATALLLAYGIAQLNGPRTVSYIWSLGIGAVRSGSLVTGPILKGFRGATGLLNVVLLANLPQALLSFLYLCYNNLFTTMCLAQEWDSFSHLRKGLRVSRPNGEQRSKYFLQLPYRYAIPMVIVSLLFHWLVSQSLFLANITMIGPLSDGRPFFDLDPLTGVDKGRSITTLGYSPVAIILSLVFAIALTGAALAMGATKLQSDIPLAGSCSAPISAACHPPRGEGERGESVAMRKVMWGAVDEGEEDRHNVREVESRESEVIVEHCAFSSKPVRRPVEGRLYAGRVLKRHS